MIKKVIYLFETTPDNRDFERFGVDILEKNGFQVYLWDCTPFLHPDYYNNTEIDHSNIKNYNVYPSMKELISAISNLDNNYFVICHVEYCSQTYPMYRAMSKNNIQYCLLSSNALPIYKKWNFITSLLKKRKNLTLHRIFNWFFKMIPYSLTRIKTADLLLVGGEKSINYRHPIGANTEILWAHTFDYDIFLRGKEDSQKIPFDYAVFIDEFLPFHSDYTVCNIKPYATPEKYYPYLCSFFDVLEAKHIKKVIIAAHPRSDYDNHQDYFSGRQIIKGRTFELVKKSKFVIAHCTTAINFAILLKKPIIIVTTDEISDNVEGLMIDYMALSLRKKAINLNKISDVNLLDLTVTEALLVDEKVYDTYRNLYIKKDDSEDLLFWQIVANRLKEWRHNNA